MMEKITKAAFNKWAEDKGWFQLNEGSSSNGRQATFLTPSGALVVVTYDLSGNLFQVGIIGPAPAPQSPRGFLGGMPPFAGKG